MKKETVKKRQVFSCEFCEISKNTFFIEHVWATAYIHPLSLMFPKHCLKYARIRVFSDPYYPV